MTNAADRVMYVHNKAKEVNAMETFYTVTMTTKDGRKLMLSMVDGQPKWTFDIDKACCWNTYEKVVKFSKEWFKSFESWHVEEIKVDVSRLD